MQTIINVEVDEVKRVFIPGQEWVYFQIYCGNYSADYILRNDILLIVDELLKKKLIDKWFFIRYNDPSHHLRVRFHLANLEFVQNVIQVVNTYFIKMIEKQIAYDINIGTYKREIERYGADTIIEVEKLFYYNSSKIIKLINFQSLQNDEIKKIFASLHMFHEILKYFEIPLSRSQQFIEEVHLKLKLDYYIDRNSAKKISQIYSQYRKDILLLLREGKDPEYLEGLNEIMKTSEEEIKTMKSILYKIKKKNEIISMELISALVHMNINRAFRSKPQEYEMLCYGFMNQYFKSIVAQK